MDLKRFDALTEGVAETLGRRSSRRFGLAQAVAIAVGVGVLAEIPGEARHKGKKKRKHRGGVGSLPPDGTCAAEGEDCRRKACCEGLTCLVEPANPGSFYYCG